MIFQEFIKICIKILKFDRNFFKDEKNFGQASIYFGLVIIILGSIISIIPNSSFLISMSKNFNLGSIQGPSLKTVVITAVAMWLIKAIYLFFVGVILFPSKKTNCDFRKVFILVAFLLFISVVTYIWYNISLIIGLKIFLNYENYLKPTLISLAPHIIIFIWILSLFQNSSGTIS